MSFGKQLKLLEKEHCLSGKLPTVPSLNHDLYSAQVGQWDARKSEEIALSKKVHPLLRARSLIMRGKFNPAQKLLRELTSLKSFELDRVEIDLENARIANAHANWPEAVRLATRALESGPTAVTELTLFQVRSLAYFEQGFFSETLNDLKNTETLCDIFPKSCAGFYARVLRAKTLARTRSMDAARAELSHLWKWEEMNSDLLLTLIRAEIDFRRLEQRPTLDLSICSFHVAHILGDLLYQNLALVDIFHSLDPEGQNHVKNLVEIAKREFIRVQILCDEIESETPHSTTAQTIQRFQKHVYGEFSADEILDCPKAVLFPKARRLFHFELNRCCKHDSRKIELALSLLAKKSNIEKSEFFRNLWGAQKYSSRLHDSLIWNLLSRMRKDFSLDLSIEGSRVVLKSKIEVLAL